MRLASDDARDSGRALRAAAGEGLGFLGVGLDEARNRAAEGDVEIGSAEARVRVLVLESREDLEIARQVRLRLGVS